MKHFFLNGGKDEIEKILQTFADLVGDESSPRLDVCKAFVDRDGQAFDEALSDLILEYKTYYQEGFSRDEILEEVWGHRRASVYRGARIDPDGRTAENAGAKRVCPYPLDGPLRQLC